MKNTLTHNLLRTIALIVVLVGAGVSLVFLFRAGSKQSSVILIGLFVGWVLSPFIGLLVANTVAKRLPFLHLGTLHWLMIILTLGSLIGYSGALSPPETKPAFVFLVIPFASWLLIAVFILLSRWLWKKTIKKK